MTSTPSAYLGGVVSARSRRLRTVGVLLLIAVLGMAFYGSRVLMPPILHAARSTGLRTHASAPETPTPAAETPSTLSPHARRTLRAQILFAYAYWTVCALLILTLVFIAWMDLREVSRNYLTQRRDLWTTALPASAKGTSPPTDTADSSQENSSETAEEAPPADHA